jgi:bifunctional non-homologous end joining protein LigD
MFPLAVRLTFWCARSVSAAKAALRNRQTSFVIDGEAVLLGVDGISDFNALHSRRHDDEVQLYAFDVLALDGEDLRKLPLHLRKNNLARLLARRPEGIFVSEFEQGEIGPTYSGKRVNSALRAWFRSAGRASIAPAGRRTGSR